MSSSVNTLKFSYTEQRRSPRLTCFLPVSEETQTKYGIHHISDLSLNGIGAISQTGAPFSDPKQLIEIQVLFPGKSTPVELITQKVFQQDRFIGLKLVSSEKSSQKYLQDFYLKLCSGKTLEENVFFQKKPVETVSLNGNKVVSPYSNKRVAERRQVDSEFTIELSSKGKLGPIKGKVLDESEYGVSFLFESNMGVPILFGKGHKFEDGVIRGGAKTIHTGPAKVCHLTPMSEENGKRLIKVGISLGSQPQRPDCQVERIDLKKIKTELSNGILKSQQNGITSPFSVQFQNNEGETLAGLLNTTFGEKVDHSVPLVIIPPGYGQRKESAALLAQILIHTFIKQGKDLAVLRFDFTRTVGESYTDQEGEHEGSEYLTFTFSQAVEDIKAAIQFGEENSYFNVSDITLLSSCFASPVVRRVLTEEVSDKVGLWLNFFGVTSPADWFSRFSDGNDLLSEFQSGIRKGIVSFSDSLVNMDRLNEDLVENNLASFEDAMREMQQINIPVTWICGDSQESANEVKEIRKLMTLPATAPRKMIRLDTQQLHFQHVKATPSFYLITQELFAHLHGKKVSPSVPDPEDFKELHKKEWARLSS